MTKLGITPMGGAFPVVAGERYKFRVRGYNSNAKDASLYVKGNSSDIVWPGATITRAVSADVWTENTFTIPAGVTQITLGVLWTDNTAAVAGTDYLMINAFELERLTAITPEYQYDLKDHLGNVRITFTTKDETVNDLATLETANLNAESGKFLRIDKAKRVNHAIFDHTNGAATGYSARLSGAANEKFGLAKSVAVMPGDVVYTEVYAKYVDTNTSNWTGAFSTLIGQVAANTAGVVVDGGNYSSSTSSFPYGTGYQNTTGSTGGPKAYLNWLVFDKNKVFKTAGYQRISTTPREYGQDVAHEKLSTTLNITEAGYVYIYLSNEEPTGTPVEVYFDDFKVTHTKSPVVQGQDYYPFGLTFNEYRRESMMSTKHLYNEGSELQEPLSLDVYQTHFRILDQIIGRWWTVDPKVDSLESVTPYNYSFNNPIRYNDPKGDCPDEEPDCQRRGGMSAAQAATQSNVTDNLRSSKDNASKVLSAKLGVQAAGIGFKIKVGGVASVEGQAKALEGEMKLSGEGVDAKLSAVSLSGGMKLGKFGVEGNQKELTFDGIDANLRETEGSLNLGAGKYGNSANEVTIGGAFGYLSGELSADLDAVKETFSEAGEAVRSFFQNLFPNPLK